MYAYIVYGLTLRRVYEEKEKKNSKTGKPAIRCKGHTI
jgi:hypothetical protein